MEAPILVTILASTVLFTLSHVWIWRRVEMDWQRAFKLSRGIAALVLTILGVTAMVVGRAHWTEGYLYRHEPGDWMGIGVGVVYGHFLSDMLWMACARARFGVRPRRDLVFHHLIGLVVFAVALQLGIGFALALVTLVSEVMPYLTALEALGGHLESPRLERFSVRARLVALVLWRIPFWGFLLLVLTRTLQSGSVAPDLEVGYQVAIGGLILLIGLDLFWVRKCAAAVKVRVEAPERAVLPERLDDRAL